MPRYGLGVAQALSLPLAGERTQQQLGSRRAPRPAWRSQWTFRFSVAALLLEQWLLEGPEPRHKGSPPLKEPAGRCLRHLFKGVAPSTMTAEGGPTITESRGRPTVKRPRHAHDATASLVDS